MANQTVPDDVIARYSPLKVMAWVGGMGAGFAWMWLTLDANGWQAPPGRYGYLYWMALPSFLCLFLIGLVMVANILRVRGVAIARYGNELQINTVAGPKRLSLYDLMITAIPAKITVSGMAHTSRSLVDQVTLHGRGGGEPINFVTGLLHERSHDIARRIDEMIIRTQPE